MAWRRNMKTYRQYNGLARLQRSAANNEMYGVINVVTHQRRDENHIAMSLRRNRSTKQSSNVISVMAWR